MRELFKELKKCLLRGEGAALASIIESAGSTPRGAGSRMLVKADGTALGTVGGGAVEYQVTLACREAVQSSRVYFNPWERSRYRYGLRGRCDGVHPVCGS